jgi:hypothetical protein
VVGDGLKALFDRESRGQLEVHRLNHGGRLRCIQGIAALGLADVADTQRHVLQQRQGEVEKPGRLARLEFEFYFADGRLRRTVLHGALVQRQFNFIPLRQAQQPRRTPDPGGEYRHQPLRQRLGR